MTEHADLNAAAVNLTVKRVVVRESRLSIDPSQVADDELLRGELLHVTSVGLLGMLVRLEDELGVTLPDDLFAGRSFHTVADLVEVVTSGARRGPA
jgi:acyl carrier protein